MTDKKIASKIIHIERAAVLAKTYKILTRPLETESQNQVLSFVRLRLIVGLEALFLFVSC